LAKSHVENENIEDAIKTIYKKTTYKNINNYKLESLVALYKKAIKKYENDPESLKEFLNIEDTNKHHAGLTIVANAIMNLDEFLTHA
jgi:hypothetical protein